jgi:hypothetical protein
MISASTAKVQYNLTSGAAALAIPFYFIENSHVRVIRTRDGEDSVISAGFTISGAGNEDGGTLTLDGTTTLSQDRITIKRSIPLTQLTSYVPNDRFPASTHERALDRLTMIAQQLSELAGRSLIFGEGEVIAIGNILPGVAGRERAVLGFDVEGELDLTISMDDVRRLIVANPVDALTDVTDYGSTGDPTTEVVDYGSTA